MQKFSRVIWMINGVVLLSAVVLILGRLSFEFIHDLSTRDTGDIIVGDKLEQAKKEGLILQGLDYGWPERVRGTDGHILMVRSKTYETPRRSTSFKFAERRPEMRVNRNPGIANIIFLNDEIRVTKMLLKKKGFIQSCAFPSLHDNESDTLARNIIYAIGYEDSNRDGLLNDHDYTDLYISDLVGDNLTKVTSNVNVEGHYFLTNHEILIKYFKRDDVPQEHKTEYFAKYNIKTKKLEELSDLHDALNAIAEQISK